MSFKLNKRQLWLVLFFASVFLYLGVVAPSLSGEFVFDDFANLYGLRAVHDFESLLAYSFDGISSQLGRPVSYFSFGLQAASWPGNPLPFKVVNILIHIFNSILVYLICHYFSVWFNGEVAPTRIFALGVSIVWLMMPIHASTVFYVVQRMTLLSATFTLLALYTVLLAFKFHQKHVKSYLPVFGAFGGMGLGYLLGVLSKENAILLGGFAALIYRFFHYPSGTSSSNKLWVLWFWTACCLPLVLLVLYFSWGGRFLDDYNYRDFTLSQRLLTEPVILWDYVEKIIFPRPSVLNIFNESFPVAKSLFEYPFPLVALLAWSGALISSIKLRQSYPFLFFGIAWYLFGHSLESSFIGLELYFEHRNYLPSLGLVILLVAGAIRVWMHACSMGNGKPIKILVAVLSCTLIINMIFTLRVEATSWQSQKDFVDAAIVDRPNSQRAWQEAASYYVNSGDVITSAAVLHYIDNKWPNFPGTTANQLLLKCLDENVKIPDFQILLKRLEEGLFDRSVIPALKHMLDLKDRGECNYLSWDDYRTLVEALIVNPRNKTHFQNAVILVSFSYVAEKQYLLAANNLDRFRGRKDVNYQLMQAQFFIMAKQYSRALNILDYLEQQVAGNLKDRLAYSDKVKNLKSGIQRELTKIKASNGI